MLVKALPQDASITLRHDAWGDVNGQPLILLVGEHAEAIDHARDQLAQVHEGPRQGDSAGIGPREQQQVFHEPREPIDVLQHAADDLAVPLGRE